MIGQAQRFRPVEGGHVKHISGGDGGNPERGFMDQRGQAHVAKDIQVVVARRAVGTERDVDTPAEHVRYRGEPRSQLQVSPRAVQHLDVILRQKFVLFRAEPDAVGQAEPWGSQAILYKKFHIGIAGLGFHQCQFGAVLRGMGVDQQIVVIGQALHTFPQGHAATQHKPRGQGVLDSPLGGLVPSADQVFGRRQAVAGRLLISLLAVIHHHLSAKRADAAVIQLFKHDIHVSGAPHVEHSGDPAGQHLV